MSFGLSRKGKIIRNHARLMKALNLSVFRKSVTFYEKLRNFYVAFQIIGKYLLFIN